MIILDLVLKGYWYDLIVAGKKQAEYREIKPYWTKRLFSRPYTHVRMRRGYTKETMLFEITEIGKTTDKNDLGLSEAYKIVLGKRMQGCGETGMNKCVAYTRICPICGKEFIPSPNQKYCSAYCRSTRQYREREARKNEIARLNEEADWLASRIKCDNRFTPEQEAACISENGPCAKCLRDAARRAVRLQ